MKRFLAALTSLAVLAVMVFPAIHVAGAGPNLIANPSVETSAGSLPTDWTTTKTGTNTTAFSYLNTGRTGTRSLQIQTTQRTSGQAQWDFTSVNVSPSTTYTYTDWYKSNAQTTTAVIVKNSNGTTTTLSNTNQTASAATWKQTSVTFKTSASATSISVQHYLNRVGQLTLDDFSLTGPTPVIPTISLTSPINGAVVSGTQTLNATATNAVGVQFKVDGVNVGLEDTTAPYSVSWNSKTATNGSHTITATARSTTGDTTTSSATVSVNNASAPNVTFTSPSNGATVSGTAQAVAANASDAIGVTGVQFKLDTVNLGAELTAAPFTTNWDTNTVADGSHTLAVVARNGAGLTASSSIIVNVQNGVVIPPVMPSNLVPNPSAETANGNVPQNWSSSSWGTNSPVYTYETTGNTGTRSVKTQITSFSSGDAKWYFDPVTVEAGKTYDYSHYYQSNVTTDVVAQFTDASGNNTYRWLNTVAPSASWQQFSSSFVVPTGTVKATVLHVLYSVGWLQIDDVSLALNIPPAPGTIPNSSLEQSSGSAPTGWQKGNWGTNTANFEYMNEGHNGNRSAKVTVTNYVDGDAKWYFDPITTLTRGKQYRFSTWYKTNSIPHAVAMFTKDDGTQKYFGMPNPQPNGTSDWQYYSETFQVPLDVKSVSAFLFMPNNGWVQVDEQSLANYQPVGFSRPLLTLTFDDGAEDNVTNALPLLNQYGFKTTQCYETMDIEGVVGGPENVMAFKNAGHEICAHTVTHPHLTQVSPTQLTYELTHVQDYLESLIGAPVTDFASPYGDYNASVINEIKKYYRSHRTVDEGYNTKDNFDIYRLRVQNMMPTTTLAQYQAWIDQAKADNTWLILVYHRIAPSALDSFDTYTSDFVQQLQAISNSGITVKTYNDALNEVVPQLQNNNIFSNLVCCVVKPQLHTARI